MEFFKVEIFDLKNSGKLRRNSQKIFATCITKQCVAMLATILKPDVVTKVSISIMDVFLILLQESFNKLVWEYC